MSYETLTFAVENGLATMTFDRPDAANGMNLAMMKEMFDVSIRCDEDPDVRALIVTGTGRFFSAGGDLKGFHDAGDQVGSLLKEMTTYLHSSISRFARMDAPVIAAVNGVAAGAGFSFACACDIVLAARSATFTMAYTAGGLSPDGSSTYFVPRAIGTKRAMELMITNRRLSADEAHDWGLVNKVVEHDVLLDEALDLGQQLAAGPTRAYGAVKRLLGATIGESLESQMESEAREIARLASETDDAREGVAAFLEKRRPDFTGR